MEREGHLRTLFDDLVQMLHVCMSQYTAEGALN